MLQLPSLYLYLSSHVNCHLVGMAGNQGEGRVTHSCNVCRQQCALLFPAFELEKDAVWLAVIAPLLEVSDPAAWQVKQAVWGSQSLPGSISPMQTRSALACREMSGQGCRQPRWHWPTAGATNLVLSMGRDLLQCIFSLVSVCPHEYQWVWLP